MTCNRVMSEAILFPFHAVAIFLTGFRLHYQLRKRRLWWDDYFAALGLAGDMVLTVGFSLKGIRSHRLAFLFVLLLPMYFSKTASRISMGLSITRICGSVVRSRWLLHTMNVSFGVMYLVSMVPGILAMGPACAAKSKSLLPGITCRMEQVAVSAAITVDIISDALLAGVPLLILRRVKLSIKKRRMITSIFAASAISSLPNFAYLIELGLSANPECMSIIIQTKVPVTLIVCNLLVVSTYFYSRCRTEAPSDTQKSMPLTGLPVSLWPTSTAGVDQESIFESGINGATPKSHRVDGKSCSY